MRVLIVGPDLSLQGGVSQVIRLTLKYPPSDVEYTHIPTVTQANASAHLPRTHPRYYERALRNLLFLARALRRISAHAPAVDLAHIHIAVSGSTLRKYLVSRVLLRKRTPFLFHNHGGHYDQFFYQLPPPLQRAVRDMFRAAQGTIVITQQWVEIQSRITDLPQYPVWLVYNPIELPPAIQPDSTDLTLRLLFLGRLGEHKGSNRVLQAVAQLPASLRARVRVYMAGDGAVEETCELAEHLGIAHLTEIRGWITGATKQRWFQETNAFVLPSRSEGLPMSLLEAMAWSKAVIVSPVGGVPEIVSAEREGFLVPADDIEALSDAIARLAESPNLRAQMGRAARARVESLDVDHHRKRLGEIYQQALKITSFSG
ncbi:MAG: glycosyltransferase family 4 protein [Fimbriimonadales bacterium]|nr:glycosyltransferase family 4 protein [Fimbriimonadales bacterium]